MGAKFRTGPESVKPDEPQQSLAARAYDILRARIVAGELRPGDLLVEHELAAALGLSRTPVREAVKLLHAEGLLEPSGGRGLTVATLSLAQASQLLEMREVVEGLAARLAAVAIGADALEAMAMLLAQEASSAGGDAATLLDINDRFHAVIHAASGNQYVCQFNQTYEIRMILLRQMTRVQFTPSPEAHEQHLAVFHAIERQDPAAAEDAMRQHIRFSRRKRLSLIASASTGFRTAP